MGILDALNLPPSRSMGGMPPKAPPLPKASQAAKKKVEVTEDGGAEWDNREVSEEEGKTWIAGGGAAGGAPAAGGPTKTAPVQKTFMVPVSLSVPLNRKFKYVELDRIDIEGEIKFVPAGDGGVAEGTGGPGIVLDKKKLAPTGKFEVDLGKLKQLICSDIEASTKQSSVQVDPKLECKVSSEGVDVSVGIVVSCGWYSGSTKFIAVAKEKGKDLQFANFSIEPISGQVKSREFEIGGVKGSVSGKIGATLVLKPAWSVIAAEVGQKVARPVGTMAMTVLGSQAFIIGGFAAIAAGQAFAFIKSVSELQDIKAWHKAAEKGWLSFRSGFGSVWGLAWNDGGAAGLRQAGVAAGQHDQDMRMQAIRDGLKDRDGEVPKDFGPAHLAALKQLVAKNANAMDLLVERSYRRGVITGFLDAYQAEHGDDVMFKSNFRALRTLLGVTS